MNVTQLKNDDVRSLPEMRARLGSIAIEKTALDREQKAIEAEILARHEAEIAGLLKAKDEPFGAVSLNKEDVPFTVTIAKKVDWDQERLAAIHADIKANGADPSEYMTVEYGVPEAKYKAWPEAIRAQFEPARTVTPGKPKLSFKEKGE